MSVNKNHEWDEVNIFTIYNGITSWVKKILRQWSCSQSGSKIIYI